MSEAATVRVRVNENCYLEYGGTPYAGHMEQRPGFNGRPSGQVWIGDEFWATPQQVQAWTTTKDGKPLARPLVTVVGTLSDEI
jgi:hypothetical protein